MIDNIKNNIVSLSDILPSDESINEELNKIMMNLE